MFQKMGIQPDAMTRSAILGADGYYINARYPTNKDAFFVTEKDIENCKIAIEVCHNYVKEFINEKENIDLNNDDYER